MVISEVPEEIDLEFLRKQTKSREETNIQNIKIKPI